MWTIPEGGAAHRTLRLIGIAIVALAVIYIPTRTAPGTIGQWNDAMILAVAAMSLNLVFGYAGLLTVGHSAFFGIGAYTTAILVKKYGWEHGWTFLAAAVIAFVIGCVVSLPAARIKGLYLVLVTLAVAVLFPTLVRYHKLEWLTDGAPGIDSAGYRKLPTWPESFLGELTGRRGRAVFHYWLAVIVVLATYLVCRGILHSRSGRALIAIRDNEKAAAVMGVNVARSRMLVFGISSALCAWAGCLTTTRTGVATPEGVYVSLLGSVVFLLAMIIGGAGTPGGPIVGAIVYVLIDTYTREASAKGTGLIGSLFGWADSSPATMILGVALIVLVFVAPYGLVGMAKRLGRRIVTIRKAPVRRAGDVTGAAAPSESGGPAANAVIATAVADAD